jgi:ketosteroid isomerase-like protein
MDEQQSKIVQYVNAYNNFDTDGMARDLDENIVFENISNGQMNLRTDGLAAFRKQAEAARQYFRKRKQRITSWLFEEHKVTIDIDYSAIISVDLPNGLKAGDALELKGKSVFEFEAGRITHIVDIS